MNERTWNITDHICRDCGGRILKCATGTGPSPGGNPLFMCADCGKANWGMSESCLCWCGFSHRGQHARAYRCLAFSVLKEHPEYEDAFRSCGCDPGSTRAVIGIVTEDGLRGGR